MTRDERIKQIAEDMFSSETRRGWLAGEPDITEGEYVARFVERHKDSDLDELEELADDARPSNFPTAHEREQIRTVVRLLTPPGTPPAEAAVALREASTWVEYVLAYKESVTTTNVGLLGSDKDGVPL
jgi:hypothetical protein